MLLGAERFPLDSIATTEFDVEPGHSLENVNVVVGGSTLMQPYPSRWMQYHQLVEPLFAAVHVSVMLYGPFTVSWRFVGAEGPPEGGGGGFLPRGGAPDQDQREHEDGRGKDDAANRHGSPP